MYEEMESSVIIKKRKVDEEKTLSMVTSLLPDKGFQNTANLNKKRNEESSKVSSDNKRVSTELKAGTSSAAEIIVLPLRTKVDYSLATASKSHKVVDPESSRENPKDNANTEEDDACTSTNSRDKRNLKTIDDALRQEYDLMHENVSSFDENHTICLRDSNGLPIPAFYENIDGVRFGIMETIATLMRALVRVPGHDEDLLDGLDEDYSEYDIDQVVFILIKRVRDTIYDMNKLLKDMEKEPFWTPLIKKGYDACCYDASRSLRYRINDRIIRSTRTKWPDIKFRIGRLSEWLDKALLLAQNVTEHKDRLISMKCVRQMIVVVLKNSELLQISNNFGDMLLTYPSDNIKFIMGVKNQLASIIKRLMSVVKYIERVQEITEI